MHDHIIGIPFGSNIIGYINKRSVRRSENRVLRRGRGKEQNNTENEVKKLLDLIWVTWIAHTFYLSNSIKFHTHKTV